MEVYPRPYIEHNLPLLLLSGLGQDDGKQEKESRPKSESGVKVSIESPESRSERSQQLLDEFRAFDGAGDDWNSASLAGPSDSIRYYVKTIGRSYTLPARKAAPLPQSPGADGAPPPPRNTELHSPLSPLSPGSPVFPDGLLPPLWFSKHQWQVPSLFLGIFDIVDGAGSSQDEQLKADINAIRSGLSRAGYKTRFAVILLSNQSILHAPELEDRLTSIRRATALDSKTGLFFMPPMSSQVEIASFVQTLLSTLQPSCIEYYRDLAKHARRKKARGGPPPQISSSAVGASQSTSTSGWNVRYEVKQGVFAEFRQEMDVAERHYLNAYEELFSAEGGVLVTTNSWSPRWNEARLLCDSIAIRIVRCQLWSNQTTGAAQSWQNYKLRMKDLIDSRGKGADTYGWEAWEARWACIMSQLIQKANLPALQKSLQDVSEQSSQQLAYVMPEKAFAVRHRLPPYNHLHHPGYWLRMFAEGIRRRWTKAATIPEEDRIPPDRSPASSVASRSKYDLYLVPDPHEEAPLTGRPQYDHVEELSSATMRAVAEFEARRQVRISEQTKLELADDLVRVGQYANALQILVQLWEDASWRDDYWHAPFVKLLRLLAECAKHNKTSENAALIPTLTWELLSIATNDTIVDDINLNLSSCLDAWDLSDPIKLHSSDTHRQSPITTTFAFKARTCHVGEVLDCQVVLTYNASLTAGRLPLSKLEITLGLQTIVVRNNGSSPSPSEAIAKQLLSVIQLHELNDGTMEAFADLDFYPAKQYIFHLPVYMKEAQTVRLSGLIYHVETPKFSLTHEVAGDAVRASPRWFFKQDGKIETVLLPHQDTKSANVLPKPPKVQITLSGQRKQFYTDEQVRLNVEVVNGEVETIDAQIEAHVVGSEGEIISVRWADAAEDENIHTISRLEAARTAKAELVLQGPSDPSTLLLTLDLRYRLVTDTEATLTKTLTLELPFITPFESNFTFAPQLHRAAWPSYFSPDTCGSDEEANGIPQRWSLGVQLGSLVGHILRIDKLEVQIHGIQGDATCEFHDAVISEEHDLLPDEKSAQTFELVTQKTSLDDRRPSQLDLSLIITWSQPDVDCSISSSSSSSTPATTTIAIPRLIIPTSEPRVLCISTTDSVQSGIQLLQYYLENPSNHFLTFSLTMEASEDFAFSGPKYRVLSLAPLSRHGVEYRLIVHKAVPKDEEGVWIRPNLQVVDSYYQKNLRVHAGGPGVRTESDDSGAIAVWIERERQQAET